MKPADIATVDQAQAMFGEELDRLLTFYRKWAVEDCNAQALATLCLSAKMMPPIEVAATLSVAVARIAELEDRLAGRAEL